jgi:hypothetical protein
LLAIWLEKNVNNPGPGIRHLEEKREKTDPQAGPASQNRPHIAHGILGFSSTGFQKLDGRSPRCGALQNIEFVTACRQPKMR